VDIKQQLGLPAGKYVVANCGKFPSEKNCQLVIMAPQAQRADLVEAAAAHAVRVHGHKESPQLRKELDKFVVTIDV
jgi:hypothetical protein